MKGMGGNTLLKSAYLAAKREDSQLGGDVRGNNVEMKPKKEKKSGKRRNLSSVGMEGGEQE